MAEILWAVSGSRLPVVMAVAGRALSSPINVHGDHSDSIGLRETGWIQLYSETAQEAYENTLLAIRLAEDERVRMPVMVMLDGFFTSHNVEDVRVYNDSVVRKFLGKYKPGFPLFDLKNPVSYGPLALPNYYFEFKYQQQAAMQNVVSVFKKIANEFKSITTQAHKIFEEYKTNDAEYIIVAMGSSCGTIKNVVDKLRKDGQKVGLLKVILYRPFPYNEIAKILAGKKGIAILDRAMSFGAQGALSLDIKTALYDAGKNPKIQNYIYGLGGRDFYDTDAIQIFKDLQTNKFSCQEKYIGLRK
jgi:pyruvate ferredoxin oxidoreductase alpha subunit